MRRMTLCLAMIATATVFGTMTSRAQELTPAVHAFDDRLALTPPMGWYPWNTFGEEPQNEKLIQEIADALIASGMRDAGYSYVGPDEGICFSRAADGKLTTNRKRYPGGLRGLGDSIHQRGLKYALYTDAGTLTCSKAMPGTRGREFEDMRRFADWRCDYLKIDWCNAEGQDIIETYARLHDAQHAAGRPIVHSLCSWGVGSPWKWAAAVGHLWRTTPDICAPGLADWDKAMKTAWANEPLYRWAGPGHWNDPDMLIAGMPGLSESQNRGFFSLWCMMAAPLMAGNDPRNMSPSTIRILTNPEAIGVDQDPLGMQGHIVRGDDKVSVWAGKRLYDGSQAFLVLNRQSSPATVQVKWSDLGLAAAQKMYVRNLWTHETTGPHASGISVTVAPDDVSMLRISKTNAFPLPPVIVADSYRVLLHTAGAVAQTLSAVITIRNTGSAELPFWQVRKNLPAWLSVAVTRKGRSQTFANTVSTAGLKKGAYHAIVRADNTEPLSGMPMSALYYDVDLEVAGDIGDVSR
jgi:alpha-galactosidase